MFTQVRLEKGKCYSIEKTESYGWCGRDFNSRTKGLERLISQGRPVLVVYPNRNLSESEKDKLQKKLCNEAKRLKTNIVWFPGPIKLTEVKKPY